MTSDSAEVGALNLLGCLQKLIFGISFPYNRDKSNWTLVTFRIKVKSRQCILYILYMYIKFEYIYLKSFIIPGQNVKKCQFVMNDIII